jgi:hypothetical protein
MQIKADYMASEYFVDTVDVALLHLAALVDPSTDSERVFAHTKLYTWNQILSIFRLQDPNRKFVAELPDQGTDTSTVANARAKEFVQRMGKNGFARLEESIQISTPMFLQVVVSVNDQTKMRLRHTADLVKKSQHKLHERAKGVGQCKSISIPISGYEIFGRGDDAAAESTYNFRITSSVNDWTTTLQRPEKLGLRPEYQRLSCFGLQR